MPPRSRTPASPYPATLPRPRDLTPAPRRTIDPDQVALSPDGSTVIAAVRVAEQRDGRFTLVSIDAESGARTTLFDEEDVDFEAPAISHDGARIAYVRTPRSTPAGPADSELWTAGIDGTGAAPHRRRTGTDGRRPSQFDAGDEALIATADSDGRGPVYRIPLDGSAPEQLHARRLHLHARRRSTAAPATSSRCARRGSRRRTRCASPATAR